MTIAIQVKDETFPAVRTSAAPGMDPWGFLLSLPEARITVRDLIRERVRHEVEAYNAKQGDVFFGLVQPADSERLLNGFKLRQRRMIDWQEQSEKATAAFQSNGFLLLINDRQVTDLDELVEVGIDTTATFLKLVPLVGG